MKRLLPTLILAASLFAVPVYAQTPIHQDRELAEFIRFAKQATTQQKIELLDEIVQKTSERIAHKSNDVFAGIQVSHHYPKSHALDYTLMMRPSFAQSIDMKRLATPAAQAKLQGIARQSFASVCADATSRAVLEAISINEMRVFITFNQRVISKSRASLSQCPR